MEVELPSYGALTHTNGAGSLSSLASIEAAEPARRKQRGPTDATCRRQQLSASAAWPP